jgi:uncharacterized protein RhaS with RHS repeats
VQSDPIGLDGGMSTYGYANGSPLVYSDPDGLMAGRILLRVAATRFGLRTTLDAGLRAELGQAALNRALKRQAQRLARNAAAGSPGCSGTGLLTELSLSPAAQRAILRQAMGTNGSGKVAHHVIPLEAIKRFPELMRKAAQAGFNINGRSNGALLERISHFGGHPMYNRVVLDELAAINSRLGPAAIKREVEVIAETMRNAIARGTFGPWG